MKIIFTQSFSKNFLNKYDKYFSKQDFIDKINLKFHTLIDLSYPYFKFKLNLNSVNFRWVLAILLIEEQWEKFLLPLNIFLKKDKKNWENIFWNKDWKDILELYEKYIWELEEGMVEIFDL